VRPFDLRSVDLFSGLDDVALSHLGKNATECSLSRGATLFEEGDPGDTAYVVTSGELEILKASADHSVRIAVSGPGIIVGEMSLLTGEPRSASARALVDTELVSIPKATLDALLESDARVAHALFDVFITRWREQQSRLRQSEHMAQIGVLSAGLAHEMNNPAAAVTRGSSLLAAAVERRVAAEAAIPNGAHVPRPSAAISPTSPMERAEIEDSLETMIDGLGIEEGWRLAPLLAEAGYRADALDLQGATAAAFVEAMASRAEVDALIAEVAEGSRRLSELVAALKSYSYLDQAPVQNVDVARGIEDTLLILKSKTNDLELRRDYEPGLPMIEAYGSRLNQVWTNLIDNAADAIHDAEIANGWIAVAASALDDSIVVVVANNGPEIPQPVRDRIFEAFFTTKEPGRGTGLGLDTVHDIVVNQHRGTIDVDSNAERTTFTVSLPIQRPEAEPA
jgi:signal transduction histidine kinase